MPMNYFSELVNNKILVSTVLGWLVAQVLKTILHTIVNKKFVAERLVGTGGMPSSHSATVCGLTTAVCVICGPGSPEFAVSAAFAIVVMYDALGVRRQAGEQAKVLNQMLDSFHKMGDTDISPEERLKEFVGHTPSQVVVGALIGILIALLVCNVL